MLPSGPVLVLALAFALAACGGDEDAVPRLLAGSPAATRALAFEARGTPVAIGGTSTFGLAQLQRQDGETWTRAAGVAAFGTRAQLLGGRALPLYAVGDAQLYRLDDAASFTWSVHAIPQGATVGTMFGVDADGLVYALDLAGSPEGDGAVMTWSPGELRWTEVAGTRPLGIGATGFTVAPTGRLAWTVPAIGIVGVDAGAQVTLVDCTTARAGCGVPRRHLAFDADETLTFLACAPEAPPHAVVRLRAGTTTEVVLPAEVTACHGLDTIADGTSLLASLDETDADLGGLFVLGASAQAWDRVAGASRAVTYVLRDRSTAFAFGDGQVAHGIFALEL